MVTDREQTVPPEPDSAEAHFQSGNLLREQGKWEEAVVHYEQTLRLRPDHVDALSNLGIALAEQGELDDAIASWRRALEVRPCFAQAYNNLGVALTKQGKLEEAQATLEEARRLQPNYAEPAYNLAFLFRQQGKRAEAIRSCEDALRLQPDHAQAYNNLGLSLLESGKPAEAAVMLRQAVRLRPAFIEALNNLGLACAAQGLFAQAEASYHEALHLNPRSSEIHANLGNLYAEQGRLDEALACYQLAVWLHPASPIRWTRALALLENGDFERGWPEYECRWQLPEMAPHGFPQPLWDGTPLKGRTILLHREQGLGDTLQFIRYAPLVQACGGTVFVACPDGLIPLFSRCAGIDRLVVEGSESPAFDVQAPLMSLPLLCGTTLPTIPARVPYLFPDPDAVAHWRGRLGAVSVFRIGIVWQGNPAHVNDRHRSIPLAEFEPLARLPGVRLYSLQKGAGVEQLSALAGRFEVHELAADLDADGGAFMETAAIMKNLDLIIAPDTAVAHLAGGLDVPVWAALAVRADWRWLRDREDSPWYPRMRLFRQTRPGAWTPLFERMAAEVSKLLVERAVSSSSC